MHVVMRPRGSADEDFPLCSFGIGDFPLMGGASVLLIKCNETLKWRLYRAILLAGSRLAIIYQLQLHIPRTNIECATMPPHLVSPSTTAARKLQIRE